MAGRKKPRAKRLPGKDRLSSITSHEAAQVVNLSILGPQWRHWVAIQGKLCAPDGQAFTPEELMEVKQLRQELNACEAEVTRLRCEQEEASRRQLEDQPLPPGSGPAKPSA